MNQSLILVRLVLFENNIYFKLKYSIKSNFNLSSNKIDFSSFGSVCV